MCGDDSSEWTEDSPERSQDSSNEIITWMW